MFNSRSKSGAFEIEAREVQRRLTAGDKLVLLDVREDEEVNHCRISGALHIPMYEVPERLHELNAEDEIVVYCRVGARSREVVRFLQARGFTKALNLRGGITQWSLQVDPNVPLY